MPSIKGGMPRSESGGNNPLTPAQLPSEEPQTAHNEAVTPAHRARALVSADWQAIAKTGNALQNANARSFIYRFLARAFSLPEASSWEWLCHPSNLTAFCAAVRRLTTEEDIVLRETARSLVAQFHPGQFEPFLNDYLAVFGQILAPQSVLAPDSARGSESQRTDLEACCKAFGLELARGCSWQQDQFPTALEFISLLAAKEVVALERHHRGDPSSRYHLAQQKFLADFLCDYVAGFCETLSISVGTGLFGRLCQFTLGFVQSECQHQRLDNRTAKRLSLRPTV